VVAALRTNGKILLKVGGIEELLTARTLGPEPLGYVFFSFKEIK
jgi:hypothetical protein